MFIKVYKKWASLHHCEIPFVFLIFPDAFNHQAYYLKAPTDDETCYSK